MSPQADGNPSDEKKVWRPFDHARNTPQFRVDSFDASLTAIPEVSAMLGHANLTSTVYRHFLPKMKTDSMARFAAAIFDSKKPLGDEALHDKATS